MTEHLALVLKICLLVLLYLFFLRVLRAVWAEVREPAAVLAEPQAPAGRPQKATRSDSRRRKRSPHELAFLEPPGLAGSTQTLSSETTIGRGGGCTIVLDDHYVSSVHTRVFQRDDTWLVEDLGSTNGTYVNRHKVTGATVIHRGDQIQVGNAIMEVR